MNSHVVGRARVKLPSVRLFTEALQLGNESATRVSKHEVLSSRQTETNHDGNKYRRNVAKNTANQKHWHRTIISDEIGKIYRHLYSYKMPKVLNGSLFYYFIVIIIYYVNYIQALYSHLMI